MHVFHDRGLKCEVGVYADYQETTLGYVEGFKRTIQNIGLFKHFVSDRRSTFVCLAEKDKKFKFNTTFNKLLDDNNITYKFTSNANGKPVVEGNHGPIKKRLKSEVKNKNIQTLEELNDFLNSDDFLLTMRYRINKMDFKNETPISKQEKIFHKLFYKSAKCTVQKNSRILHNNKEYTILNDNTVFTMKPKTKAFVKYHINGSLKLDVNNRLFDLKQSNKITIKQIEVNAVEIFKRKIRSDYCITHKKVSYVIKDANNKALRLPENTIVEVQTKGSQIKAYIDKKCYRMIKKDDHAEKYTLLERRLCAIKFHCLINAHGKTYVLIDKNNNIIFTDVEKCLIMHDGLTLNVFDYDYNRLGIAVCSSLYSSPCNVIPKSNLHATNLLKNYKLNK